MTPQTTDRSEGEIFAAQSLAMLAWGAFMLCLVVATVLIMAAFTGVAS